MVVKGTGEAVFDHEGALHVVLGVDAFEEGSDNVLVGERFMSRVA